MTTIRVDHENNGEEFWPALTEYDAIQMAPIGEPARAAAAKLAESGCDAIEVDDETAEELLGWFSTLPGWAGGPAYAPHPVTVS